MNIREFAALCGVSHSTVSRVMNHPPEKARAGRETYDRIRAKAAEVGFQVNYYAQALHSKNTNCLGFIIGGQMSMLTEPLLFGISRTLNLQRKNLAVHPCDNTQEAEAEAFDKMMFYNADAVFYIPSLQKEEKYSTSHIREVLARYPDYPPVIAVYGGTDIPDFFQVRFRDYDIGKQAALRQLACGCRKFGIVISRYSNFMNREMARGYRETLLNNGIPACNIAELSIWPDGEYSESLAELKEVEGLWICHYVALLLYAQPLLACLGDTGKLHVDCITGIETENMYQGLQPFSKSGKMTETFFHWFGSIVIYKYSLAEVGAKAAEIALQLLLPENTKRIPKITYIKATPALFSKDERHPPAFQLG